MLCCLGVQPCATQLCTVPFRCKTLSFVLIIYRDCFLVFLFAIITTTIIAVSITCIVIYDN